MADEILEGSRVVEVALPNGAVALVRAKELDAGLAEKVGWPDQFDFKGVAGTLEGLADAIHAAVDAAKPTKLTVELAIELAVKAGKLVGLLVEGEGSGSLTVTLEWQGENLGSG